MKNIKRRIAAWVVAGAMISSLAACESKNLKYQTEESTGIERLVGQDLDRDELDKYYIIELIPTYMNVRYLYLCKRGYIVESRFYSLSENLRLAEGSRDTSNKFYNITSEYGQVVNIFEIKDIVIKYKGIKKYYTAKEIEDVFESFKNDYQSFDFSESRVYYNEELDKQYSNNKVLIKK